MLSTIACKLCVGTNKDNTCSVGNIEPDAPALNVESIVSRASAVFFVSRSLENRLNYAVGSCRVARSLIPASTISNID